MNRVDLINHMKICNGKLELVKLDANPTQTAPTSIPDGFVLRSQKKQLMKKNSRPPEKSQAEADFKCKP